MGKILIIKGADFSAVAVGKIEPPTSGLPVITISTAGSVTISASGAIAIYYTTNGSTPTKSSSKYTSAFTVLNGTTVKAIAEFADGSISSVVSKKYSGVGGTLKTYTSTSRPDTQTTNSGGAFVGWFYADTFISQFREKQIKSISFYLKTAGEFSAVKITETTENGVVTTIKTVVASGTGFQKIEFDTPIILTGTESIGLYHKVNGTEGAAVGMYSGHSSAEPFGAKMGRWEAYNSYSLPCIIEYYE